MGAGERVEIKLLIAVDTSTAITKYDSESNPEYDDAMEVK